MRRWIPAILTLTGNIALGISPWESAVGAVVLVILMIPTALFGAWPYIRRVRFGLAPPNAEQWQNGNAPLHSKPDFVELKARCLHLGKEVEAFDNSRRGIPGNATNDYVRRRDEETIRLYHERLKPKIMRLYDELAPDWFDEGDKDLFENVSDWRQLEDVAERLEIVGERLPEARGPTKRKV